MISVESDFGWVEEEGFGSGELIEFNVGLGVVFGVVIGESLHVEGESDWLDVVEFDLDLNEQDSLSDAVIVRLSMDDVDG